MAKKKKQKIFHGYKPKNKHLRKSVKKNYLGIDGKNRKTVEYVFTRITVTGRRTRG